MVMISLIVCEIWQNTVFLKNLYKNHILYGCHGNKYGQKKYTCQKYNLDTRLSFYDALKIISQLVFTKFGRHMEWYTRALGMEFSVVWGVIYASWLVWANQRPPRWIELIVLAARIDAIAMGPWHALPHLIAVIQPKRFHLQQCGENTYNRCHKDACVQISTENTEWLLRYKSVS